MRVILNQDIQNLGEEGDIKQVAAGFARNYLLPRKLVMPYTRQNLRILEQKKVVIDRRKDEKRKNASEMKDRLEAEQFIFAMTAGPNGKLFGSVNTAMLAEALEKKGYHIERKKIEIPDNTIRMVGQYEIKVKLYEQKEAVVKVIVEQQQETTGEKPAETRVKTTADTTEKTTGEISGETIDETTEAATEETTEETT